MAKKLRIVLAEDHHTVREGIKLLVNSQPDMEVVGEADDGEKVVALVADLAPDIILMDIAMPNVNGLRATKRLRSTNPHVKILMLTRHTDDGYLQQLIGAGANGYILKQSAPNELVKAIKCVANGDAYLDSTLTEKVLGVYGGANLRGENKNELTTRESEVLRLIAFGYTNKDIASTLDLSVKTIEAHKAHAMAKLGITNRIGIVRYAILQDWLHET